MRLRRIAATAALGLTASLLGLVSPTAASAAQCSVEAYEGGPVFYVICPGNGDVPVGVDHAVVTTLAGPGYGLTSWNAAPFVKVNRGGRVTFVNNGDASLTPVYGNCYMGAGFNSYWVEPGQSAEVQGVSSLRVGTYHVTDCWGTYKGDLVITDPATEPVGPVEVQTTVP